MPKTITLTDIQINSWLVDIINQRVVATYHFLDDQGNEFGDQQTAIFWVTIPAMGLDPGGNPIPAPDNWYQLPSGYVTTLTSLNTDLYNALLTLVA